ncbi:MAG: family N-acetyltransferase [Paucimonas sp.]|nr:family N-acetyltransferase [Paucimonas sp.]
MNSTDVFTNAFAGLSMAGRHEAPGSAEQASVIRVKELDERDRRRLLMHFLSLGEEDRTLRFGAPLSDELVTRYVQRIDFHRDVIFGVFDSGLSLAGVGHLAFAPRDALPAIAGATTKSRLAEFGLSVLDTARGRGIGSKLFERAAMRCRNEDIDTLTMHCLAVNQAMIHIARKAGMEVQRDYGEADAYLKLLPASPSSVLREAVDEQVAVFDYVAKANARMAHRLLDGLSRMRRK